MDKIANRKRCLNCKYYKMNVCPLMANADVFKINTCILEYKEIKSIKEDTLEYFVFFNNPIEFLSYLGYKNRKDYPKVGETVLTLTGGFSSVYSGKFIHVDAEDEYQLHLSDEYGHYAVSKDNWWKQLFRINQI